MTKEHNYGIDLLRLVLMFMICILHVLGQGGILFKTIEGTTQYSIFWFMEIFCYCAVDAFALISGYMAVDKPCKYDKLINIWFKVFFYSFIVTIFFVIIGKADNIKTVDIIKNAFPITFNKYWYMTAYFLMLLSTPLLNPFLFKIDEKSAKKAFIIMIILFTLIGSIGDPFTTMKGYSALWLIVLYCLGALGNKMDIFGRYKSITLMGMWLVLLLVTWYGYVYLGIKELVTYISPTILFIGLIMVVLFKRIRIKSNIIASLASLSLAVYLLQCNQVIWNNIILDAFTSVLNERIIVGVLHILGYSALIWAMGLGVEFVRSKLAKLFKIDLLSQKIVSIINNV